MILPLLHLLPSKREKNTIAAIQIAENELPHQLIQRQIKGSYDERPKRR